MRLDVVAMSVLERSGITLDVDLPSCPIRHKPILSKYPQVVVNWIGMQQETCGIYVESRGRHYITINTNTPYVRQRFSLAHEFGHYILAHGDGVSLQGEQDAKREREANLFARRLLMPEVLVLPVHERLSTIHDMAQWFRVHDVTMAIRLQELQLRPFEAKRIIEDYRRSRSSWSTRGETWQQDASSSATRSGHM